MLKKSERLVGFEYVSEHISTPSLKANWNLLNEFLTEDTRPS